MFPKTLFPPNVFPPALYPQPASGPTVQPGVRSAFLFFLGSGGRVGSAPVGTLPIPGDVRLGVVYDFGNLPAPRDVEFGIVYG